MTEHIALPLRIRMHRQIVDANDRILAVCENPATEYARFIVTACNCHADLLEALKYTREALLAWETECPDSWDSGDVAAVAKADEAIRKAEETP